jgi:hypothetical protein
MEKHYKIPIIIIGIKVSGTKEFFFILFIIHFDLATYQTQKDPWQFKSFSKNIHAFTLLFVKICTVSKNTLQ